LRILVLSPEYLPSSGGGIVTFYRLFLPDLVAAGHSVRLIQGSGQRAERTASRNTIEGVVTEVLEVERLERHLARFSHLAALPGLRLHLAASWAMWEQAGGAEDFDVVEACDWGLSFIPPLVTGNRPTFVQMHGSIGQIDQHDPATGEEAKGVLIRMIEAAVLQRASAIQCTSDANARFWQLQTRRKISKLLPGWRSPALTLANLEAGPSGLVLGRVQRWKGPHILCEALRLLGARAPSIEWYGRDTMYGERTSSTAANLAKTYPDVWGKRIHHRPQVDPQAAAALQRTTLFNVVPSTWDVFNFTCVEAMASGRPVICSRGAGASELIEDGVTGFLFEAGDAASLAGTIDRLLCMGAQRLADIGRAAQSVVAQRLAPEQIAAERIETYTAVISSFAPQPPRADDWIVDAVSGKDNAANSEISFLNHLPLKTLLRHSGNRLVNKVRGSLHG
jgi:glycosyltransferase involved in cell wall biosynthesis